MNMQRNGSRKGFSLVELLAVVLVLAVLAAVAVPLYLNTRKTSAARTCKANIAAIAAAESAYATRFGNFVTGTAWDDNYAPAATSGQTPTGGLIGAPECLSQVPHCPLNAGSDYTVTASGTDITISCPNAAEHSNAISGNTTTVGPWQQTLTGSKTDNSNPL